MAPAEYAPDSSDYPETIPGNDVDSVFGVRLRCWVRDGPAVHRKQGGSLVIEVQHLTKQYGRFTAVDDVTFRVDKGEILGFLGPNGAGKTTTMRILTGYMPATAGKAVIAGFDIFDQPLEAKRRIGYLPETPPLYPDMTVRDYLLFVGRIRGVASKALRAQVDTAMEKARVADVATRFCGKLSKGYRQRVGLAQAILHNPEVLVLDEPTAGLDPKQIMETRDLIKGLAGSHTIILSTHILPEVSQTCERVVIINKGKVVAIDTPDALTERIQGNQTIFVQVDAPAGVDVTAALGAVPGVSRVTPVDQRGTLVSFEIDCHKGEDRRREVARLVVSSDWGLVELRPSRLSLEEIFLQLTTDEAKSAAPDAAA
jgi:ABC-2 type transport system ATP-binding protein